MASYPKVLSYTVILTALCYIIKQGMLLTRTTLLTGYSLKNDDDNIDIYIHKINANSVKHDNDDDDDGNKDDDDYTLHISKQNDIEILPLVSWERETIDTRVCSLTKQKNKYIPEYCCPGSFSTGGSSIYVDFVCNNTEAYQKVEHYAIEYLKTKYKKDQQGKCDICQIIDYLFQHNLTLSFVGDSITRQVVNGLECELHRRGYQIDINHIPWDKCQGCGWRFGISEKVQFKIRKPGGLARNTVIYHYGIYRPEKTNIELQNEIIPNSDIIIFDHGLHWKEKDEYKEAMLNYLQGYVNSNLTLLAWRETSSQHFDSYGGHYGNPRQSDACVPMKTGWESFYMPLMREAVQEVGMEWRSIQDSDFFTRSLGRNDLVFIPFRDYTSPLDYLHPTECSHFCYTPYLWLPMWRNLRIAMDQAIKKERE